MTQRHGKSTQTARSLTPEIGSIILFAGALFTLVALLTYWPSDPSFLGATSTVARNACGRIGAICASMAFETFGVAAFLWPAALFFMAAAVYKREGAVRFVGTLAGMTVAVMSLTVFLSLQWKYWPYAGTLLLTGGAFGAWSAEILMGQLNPLGASIVSLCVFLVTIALSTPVSVATFGANVLRMTGEFGFRATKVALTYIVYLVGLVAMRFAHSAGDVIQKLIEGAIRRAKERAARSRDVIAEVQSGLPAPKAATPFIGLESAEPYIEDDIEMASVPEAPNVFPELENEKGQKPAKQAAKFEILPHEPRVDENGNEDEKSATKTAARLARAALRGVKRGQWKLPSVNFLKSAPKIETSVDKERLAQNAQLLVQKFADFDIQGEITAVRPGPVITLYEFKPGPGVKVSRIASLADDLSMALSAKSVRILAPLPGKSVVGIEIPSATRETVVFREFVENAEFSGTKHSLPVIMGKDIAGQPYLSDLAKMPHLLCAGQTGSGKSVFMNGLICSLLYRFTPDELRMILIDPKFIEFAAYQHIPHLLLPVVDDPKQAGTALKWAVREMERRYRVLAILGAKNLASFNQKVEDMGVDVVRDLLLAEENQNEDMLRSSGGDWIEAFEQDEEGAPRIAKLPYIVVIIDELADLMMLAKKEVEHSIARIAQKARAAGIHLVIATQRPSTDVVTGLIKANLPSRASFQLSSHIDSRTILDRQGAERLLGQGDMLFMPPGQSQLMRLHGAYLDEEEISKITSFLKEQGKPVYRDEILQDEDEQIEDEDGGEEKDALFDEAVEFARKSGMVSASSLQRNLRVGYNRAARMIETMEERGIVGPADGARPREVLLR